QVHGGTVQGIGQALMEDTVYESATGQLLSASLMDYPMPRAEHWPEFVFETRNVPCKTNPLGVKGAGEAGAIGSCPAVINARGGARGRGWHGRCVSARHQCARRRALARLPDTPHRHAGDTAAHLERHRGCTESRYLTGLPAITIS